METQIDLMTDHEIDAVSGGSLEASREPIYTLPVEPIICPPFPGPYPELTVDAADS